MAEHRAFVAGATGYTGRALVSVLARQGFDVVAHIRPGSPQRERLEPEFMAAGARVDATAWEEAAMTATLRALAPTHVFALLGTTRKRAAAEGSDASAAYERVDYGLTALLLRATIEGCPDAKFVYLSAAGVSATSQQPYVRARARIEAELRASPLAWVIARPAIIAGDREEPRPLEAVAAAVGDRVLALTARLGARKFAQRYHSMTGQELAEGLARVALDPQSVGEVVHGETLRARKR